MSKSSAEFRITVESPYGKRATEEFRHYMKKVADEAEERWGIVIEFERIDEPADNEPEFRSAAEHD